MDPSPFDVPITALYVGIHGIFALALAIYVAIRRGQTKISLGDGGNESMLQAIRVQGNYLEYVPIALLMILVLELMQTSSIILHVMGGLLIIGRLAHWQGLHSNPGRSKGRGIGTSLTFVVYLIGIVYCLIYALN